MGINLIKNQATLSRILADRIVEQPIDTELVLPDYCPDISRMLKCRTSAKIISKSINKNILTLSGNVCVSIIYLDSHTKDVRSYSSTVSFTKECELEEEAEGCFVTARVGVDYLKCRVMTGRKLDLHGAVSIHYTVSGKEKSEIICGAEGCGIQTRCKCCDNTARICIGEKNIVVNEETEVSQTAGNIRCIIRGEAKANVSECKAVGDKAIIKGDLNVFMLYSSSNEGEICKFETVIPFSQIIDVMNVECENHCKAITDVSSLEIRPKIGMDGEAKVVNINAVIGTSVMCSFNESVKYVTDSYSTDYDLQLKRKNITIKRENDFFTEKINIKKEVEFAENIVSVVDVWCETKTESVKCSDGYAVINGTIAAHLLVINASQSPIYIEKPIEYTHKCKMNDLGEGLTAEAVISVMNTTYSISSATTVDLRIDLNAEILIFEVTDANIVVDMELNENGVKKSKGEASLIVYYSKAGENLWDIARNNNSSVKQIMCANVLNEDIIQNDMPLLIPII